MSDSSGPRVRTYLLYAVGEIALVVVGILIALQIGEWAERRSDEEALVAILREVQEELASDVEQADRYLPVGAEMQALVDSVLAGEFDRDDYLGTGWEERGPGPVGDDARFALFWLGMQYIPYTPTRNGYERLAAFPGHIPAGHRSAIDRLTAHYVQEWDLLERRVEQFVGQVENRHRHFSHTFPWYWRLRAREWSEEMVRWHMESDQRRGYLLRHARDDILRPGSYVDQYRTSAISAYLAVADALGEPPTHPAIPDDLEVADPDAVRPWTGRWSPLGEDGATAVWTITLELRGGILHIDGTPLRQVDDSTFTVPTYSSESDMVLTTGNDGELRLLVTDDEGAVDQTWVRPPTETP